ncbi:MAG TPA: hypothetical protein VFB16_07625 [Bauldia sp.]|nr:hypothetical protein [Bauldia sp.]
MGTILAFSASDRRLRATRAEEKGACEIVIFPGVRIERHELDLSHRLVDSVGDDFDGIGGNNKRPRKRS